MNLSRLTPEPGAVADFFQEALESLGAICERSWHDRLDVIAEGTAARLWREDGGLHETTLRFAPAGEAIGSRDASTDVFPGCPLTFRLAEALLPATLTLE